MPTQERRPAGTPLGRALDIPAGIAYDDLREVVAAIDRVHGDGELPAIPVRLDSGITERGVFRYDPDSGEAISISIRADQKHRGFAVLHEIGHYLDWRALGDGRSFGSIGNPLMSEWLQAVVRSRACRQLSDMFRQRAGRIVLGTSVSRVVRLTEREIVTVSDMRLPDECWARSYAQFVAIQSAEPDLVASVRFFQTPPPERVYYPRQWEDNDFVAIATTIEELMYALRWRG